MRFNRFKHAVALGVAGLCFGAGLHTDALAQSKKTPQNVRDTMAGMAKLFDKLRSLGQWERHHGYLTDSIENTWRRYGWNSETDQFAKQVALEVAKIPPWQIGRRLDALTAKIRQRYGLTQEQQQWLKERVFRETLLVATRNMSTISAQTEEAIDTRKAGEPFTPEQVARWTTNGRKLRAEIYQSLDTLAVELGERVPDDKKQIFLRDYTTVHNRIGEMKKIHASWEAGGWTPEDWGLGNDPFHAEQVLRKKALASVGRNKSTLALSTRAIPVSGWALYVRSFIARFDLDASQQTTAWSILQEMEARARRVEEVRPQPASAEGNAPANPPANVKKPSSQPSRTTDEQIAAIFEDLKARLDLLPTSAQRARASGDSRKTVKVPPETKQP